MFVSPTLLARLGVGTINPAIKLHVVDSASTPIRLQNTGGGSVYTQYVNNDNARGYVGYEGKRLAFYADNGSNTGDTRVAFMDADGLKFFNDTAQANALDDYEEGTFTPSFNGTITYTGSLTGNYTKIGKVVYFSIGLSNQAFTNATGGVAKITGLPFTAANMIQYIVQHFTLDTTIRLQMQVKEGMLKTELLILFFMMLAHAILLLFRTELLNSYIYQVL